MNSFEKYVATKSDAVDILASSEGIGLEVLVKALKSRREAKSFIRLHQVYFNGNSAKKKQAAALAAVKKNQHPLTTLIAIERIVGRLQHRRDKWALRIELCSMSGSTDTITKAGNKRVHELNDPTPKEHGVKIRSGRDNTASLTITGHRHDINNVAKVLEASGDDPLDAFYSTFFDGGASTPLIGPMVRIPIDQTTKIIEEDGNTLFGLSDGSVLTGEELAQRALSSHGWAVLVQEGTGPIDAFPFRRFATERQAIAVMIDQLVCAEADCNTAADNTRVHHVQAFSKGGKTVVRNLTRLCDFHNGRNDDDPLKPKHGRVELHGGRAYWHPPWGGQPRRNQHPVMQVVDATI